MSSCGRAAEQRMRQEEIVERSLLLATPGAFAARYPGQCRVCWERFEIDEPIMQATAHKADGYRHVGCKPLPGQDLTRRSHSFPPTS